MLRSTLLITASLLALSNALIHDAPKPLSPNVAAPVAPAQAQTQGQAQTKTEGTRRSFFSSAAAACTASGLAIATSASLLSPPQPAQAKWLFFDKGELEQFDYATFKTMLESTPSQITQVQFGSTGNSLTCMDSSNVERLLLDIPDEKGLLKELYRRDVVVTLQETRFQKKMNAVSWMRDLVGVGDDITEEEMYEYRGYKTNRGNIPDRAYVPSSLITGL